MKVGKNMKVVIAHSGLGEVMNSENTVEYIKNGIRKSIPMAKICGYPLVEGYDPIQQVVAFGGKTINVDTLDPLDRKIVSKYAIMGEKQVVIELRDASGLERLQDDEKNPLITTTYGTGLLIKDALDKGLRNFHIYTEGSAANDGGIGILTALGYRFLDSEGNSVPLNGSGLYEIREIDTTNLDKRVKESTFTLVTDYENLYSGIRGVAYGYGPLKGANPLMIQYLDRGLRNYSLKIENVTGINVDKIEGTGAGGGVGAGLIAFLGAEKNSFTDSFLRMTEINDKIKKADIVIVGSKDVGKPRKMNKNMVETVKISQKNHIPVMGVFGSLSQGYEELYSEGYQGIYALYNHPYGEVAPWSNPEKAIESMAEEISYSMITEEE